MDRVVIEQVVVARQHAGVFVSHPHVDPRLADLFDRSDVVPVAVGLEYRGHAQSTRHAQQPVVFIGRVDERRLTGSLAAHDVHVVFDWSHDESYTSARPSDPTSSTLSMSHKPLSRPVSRLTNVEGAGITSSTHGRTAMNFGFSEEQEELRKMVKRFLEENRPNPKYVD